MNVTTEPVLASVGDTQISTTGLMRFLKLRLDLYKVIHAALVEECLLRAASAAGIEVVPEELQISADRTRQRHGLHSIDATHQWLATHGLSIDDFEQSLRQKLLLEKFQDWLVSEQGEQEFAKEPERFARARLRRIVVANSDLGRELAAQIRNDGKDYADLAGAYSLDTASRNVGGDIGVVLRCQLPPETGNQIFGSRVGEVVGPIDENGLFALYLVEELCTADFDDTTRQILGSELLNRFADEQLAQMELNSSWLATI